MPTFTEKLVVEDYFINKHQDAGWRFMPANSEQRRIAEILSAADTKLELERRRKEKLERVKKELMNELLTGRRRVMAEMG